MPRSLLVLGVWAHVALAAPTIGSAQGVTPTGPVEGQKQVRVAAGDTEFLAVWEAGIGGHASIRAARLGLDGASLDPAGLTVSSGAGGQFEPAVAFGHGVYLVVWSDMRQGNHAVFGARVSPQGQLLDMQGIALSTEATAARMADVAATPDGFVVAWAQAEPSDHGFVARARRLGPDGQPVDLAPLHLTDVPPWTSGEDWMTTATTYVIAQHFRVAVLGNSAVVMWGGTIGNQPNYSIVSAPLDLVSGTQPQPPSIAVVGAQSRLYHPAVCGFGQGLLFTWTDFRERGGTGLPAANFGLLSPDGGSTYGPLESTALARIVWAPAVAPSGLVAFVDPYINPNRQQRVEYHLFVRQVAEDGTSPGVDQQVEQEAAWPALATHANGTTLLLYTLVNSPTANGQLRARLISP